MINNNLKKRIFTSITLLILTLLIIKYNVALVYVLLVFGVVSLLEFVSLINKIKLNKFYSLISSIFFTVYLFLFCSIFFLLSNFLQLKIIIFILLFGCVASDIGGFIFGKIFKGPKLTRISPNKTIAGSLGSIILTIIALSCAIYFFTNSFSYVVVIIAIITSIACQIGDLFFSFLKRKAKIKDTGDFLPGHGGILDRLDGILLGVPIGIFFLSILY
ncbi:phosphatidate cytidylyltransferase [Pelagibacteraceae bacterium]|nr:phosphatidate cytidylyltransferase [Pelagibacteraceae bacterium]